MIAFLYVLIGIYFVQSLQQSLTTNTNSVGIYNGAVTQWIKYPFMASLRTDETNEHCCGATIFSLDPPRLLTSAYCTDPTANPTCTTGVIIGCDDASCSGNEVVKYEIDSIIPHPDYAKTPSIIYDIAIIKLKETITKPVNVSIIELQQGLPCCEDDHPLVVLGYGKES